MSEYNTPFGKKNRGLTVLHSYRFLAGDKATDEGCKEAMILGWCVEWVRQHKSFKLVLKRVTLNRSTDNFTPVILPMLSCCKAL